MGTLRIRRVGARLIVVGILSAATAGCDSRSEAATRDADLEARRYELVLQFASVQSQIRGLQSEALNTPGVQVVQDSFYSALRPKMIELDPRSESLLNRATQVGHDMARAAGTAVVSTADEPTPPADLAEKQRIASELQTVERELEPIRRLAMADPHVALRFRELQDTVVAVMLALDPEAKVLLDQMRQIERDIQRIDAERAAAPGGWVDDAVQAPVTHPE